MIERSRGFCTFSGNLAPTNSHVALLEALLKTGPRPSVRPIPAPGIRGSAALVAPLRRQRLWRRRRRRDGRRPVGQGPLLVGEGRRLALRHAQGTHETTDQRILTIDFTLLLAVFSAPNFLPFFRFETATG